MSSLSVQTYLSAREIVNAPEDHDDADVAKAAELIASLAGPQIGKRYLFRTATMYSAGVILEITSEWIAVGDVEAVFETGPMADIPTDKSWGNSEKVGGIIQIARGGIIDVIPCGNKG